jgi:hypothetical protein
MRWTELLWLPSQVTPSACLYPLLLSVAEGEAPGGSLLLFKKGVQK